jgi:hypothetical protein
MSVEIDTAELAKFVLTAQLAVKALANEIADAIADRILEEAQTLLSQTPQMLIPVFDFEEALNSGEVIKKRDKKIVAFNADAAIIEFGSASFIPDYDKIFAWAQGYGFDDPKKQAWKVINKLKKEGIESHPFFSYAIARGIAAADKIAKEITLSFKT